MFWSARSSAHYAVAYWILNKRAFRHGGLRIGLGSLHSMVQFLSKISKAGSKKWGQDHGPRESHWRKMWGKEHVPSQQQQMRCLFSYEHYWQIVKSPGHRSNLLTHDHCLFDFRLILKFLAASQIFLIWFLNTKCRNILGCEKYIWIHPLIK